MTQHAPLLLHTLVDLLSTALEPHPLGPASLSEITLRLPVEVCEQAFRCLGHMFTWVPLSSLITPAILEVIFRYAYLGCHGNSEVGGDHGSLLGSLAMDCVNELLVKNCIPRDFESFLMKFFDQSFSLLHKLTRDEGGVKKDFSRLDDQWVFINHLLA